jgi:hypothetical protein
MSIQLTGDVMFAQHINGLFSGVNKWSYSVFFRYDGTPASPNGMYFGATAFLAYSLGISPSDQAAHPGTVSYSPQMLGANGIPANPNGPGLLSIGSVYLLTMTWDGVNNVQTMGINTIRQTIGNVGGTLRVSNDLIGVGDSRGYYGGTPAGAGRIWSLRDQAMWEGYILTPQDESDLMLAVKTPGTLATPATHWWTFAGTPGAVAVAGAGGLVDSGAVGGYTLTEQHSDGAGTSTAKYGDAMAWTPNAHAVAWVNTNGVSVGIYMASNTTGSWTPETTFVSDPTITITGPKGGTNIPLQATPWRPVGPYVNTYQGQFYNIPQPYAVTAQDTAPPTISAPVGWVTTQAGIAQAEVNTPLTNYLGRSIYGAESAPRTLKMGFNFPWFIGSNGVVYSPTKNYRFRSWSSQRMTTIDATGRPTGLDPSASANNPGYYSVHTMQGAANGVDLTGIPAASGLWAVGWDDTGPDVANHPTVLGMQVDVTDGSTCTEMTQYNNPGTVDGSGHRVGIVRVFNLQPGPNRTDIDVRVTYWQNQLQLHFANDVTYGPGDFTPATPTVLDRSDPYAVSDITLKRFAGGIGSMRFMDSSMANFSNTVICEPEQLRNLTDWEWSKPNFSASVPCATIRDWNAARSPYVYSGIVGGLGQSYTATLSAPITTAPAPGTVQTITISDANALPTAATGPVMTGQILVAGSEKLRVLSVSDSDGITVTVERGAVGTATATHAVGPVTVNYRFGMTIDKWGFSKAGSVLHVYEVTTANRHNLQSTQMIQAQNFPVVTYTDGTQADLNQNGESLWVTGPRSFARWTGGATTPTTSTNQTLPPGTSITLASSANMNWSVPETSCCPYEWCAIQAAAFPGCVCQVNIPLSGSDAYAYAAFCRVMTHLPGDRDLIIEYQNEVWNFGYTVESDAFATLQWALDPANYNWPHNYTHVVNRTYQLRQIAETAKANLGWTGNVRTLLNVQTAATGGILSQICNIMVARNAPATDIAQAPYWEVDHRDLLLQSFDSAKLKALHGMTTEQIMDNMSWNFGYMLTSYPNNAAKMNAQLADFNANKGGVNPHGYHLDLYGYEGGPHILYPDLLLYLVNDVDAVQTTIAVNGTELLVPGQYLLIGADSSRGEAGFAATSEWVRINPNGVNTSTGTLTVTRGLGGTTARPHAHGTLGSDNNVRTACHEIARDIERHPNFYVVDHDYNLSIQKAGFKNFNLYNYSMIYAGGYACWGAYHWPNDEPGRGDGSDGKLDNRGIRKQPGLPNTVSLATSQLTHTVSPRGQGFIDWNGAVGGSITPPPVVEGGEPPRYRLSPRNVRRLRR